MNNFRRTVCHLPIITLLAAIPQQSVYAASPPAIVKTIESVGASNNADKMEFSGRIYDFSSEHPDFQKSKFGLVSGAVKKRLDADGLPVLAKDNVFPAYGTVADFGQWYRDSPGINKSKRIKLVLRRSEDGKFRIKNNDYFPIDGELLGDEAGKWKDGNKASRNFHFTTHLSGQFSYKLASDSFTFSGDDDLWVFFDGKLGIDLGGIHSEKAQTITGEQLLALGLKPGQQYKISIFHAERHTTGSNFNIETDFKIVPDKDFEMVGKPVVIGAATSRNEESDYVGFGYLEKHFASLTGSKIDFAACGIEKGGFGGFGEKEVPTNSHGDVHIFTPDGLAYDFQAGGEFTLVASSDESVMVHTRQTVHENDSTVSSNTAVAMQIGVDVVEFYSDKDGQRIFVNGEILEDMPTVRFDLPGGGALVPDGQGKSGPRFLVAWPTPAFSARVNFYAQFLNIGVQSYTKEIQYSGLIGNLDGNPSNDMLPLNGTALICPPADGEQLTAFGDSWRLSANETLLRSELGKDFKSLTVDIVTGAKVSAETAVYVGLQQNFGSLEGLKELDIETIIITLTAIYDFNETLVRQTLAKIFEDEKIITAEVKIISIEKITKALKVREERASVLDISKIDIKVRAKAQQYCQISGVDDHLALTNCILDVARTGKKEFIESAVSFHKAVSKLPQKQRFSGSKLINVLDSKTILDEKRVIEIAGPAPDPTTDFAIDITPVGNRSQSNIHVETSTLQCSAETLPDAQALLEAEPQALAVAIFCAQHQRGWSWGANYGLNRDGALLSSRLVCEKRAEESVADWGVITQGCQLYAVAERTIRFGEGISDDDGVRLVKPKPKAPLTCAPAEYSASSVAVSKLSSAVSYFSEDGLDIALPNVGEFLFIRSADEQVVVHARRDLWVSDKSKSVITAMHLQVGSDTVEIQVSPEAYMLVNGDIPEMEEGGFIALPGGGSIITTSTNSILVTWPCTSFTTEINYWKGSHITVGFLPDPEMAYDGLVRFTERYLVTGGKSPFRKPVNPGMGCDCEVGEPKLPPMPKPGKIAPMPPAPVEVPKPGKVAPMPPAPVEKPSGKPNHSCDGADDPFSCEAEKG